MLRKFEVTNYKNFRETLSIDFTNVHDYKYNEYCVKDNLINKMIVYGKNAEGKSNLGAAIFDIAYGVLLDRSPQIYYGDRCLYKNANATDKELVEFYYSFQFGTTIVDYEYRKKDVEEVVFEKLVVNNEIIFSYDIKTGEHDFSNISRISANDLNWEEFFTIMQSNAQKDIESMQPTALRYIIYNTIQNEQSVIYKLSQFIKSMRFSASFNDRFLLGMERNLRQFVDSEDSLQEFETFLNKYGVKCKLIFKEMIDGKKEIYFDYAKPLPFSSNLSNGTKALTKFYIQYIAVKNKPSFIYLDEFDAYYHFELSEKIVQLLEQEFECQVVLTSHNTNLLSNSIMRPDCFMILNNGKLTPLCEATSRELRQGHNLEKLYMNGEFDG